MADSVPSSEAPSAGADDRALLDRLHASDPSALDRLLKAHWAALVRYAVRLLRDHDAAQDLVQETFVRLWERREQIEGGSLRAYCYRVLHNLVVDELRRRRFRSLWSLRFHAEAGGSSEEAAELDLVADGREVAVSRAIDALPARRRQTFILAHLHGLSYHEIAVIMEVSSATVKHQVAAALAQLRRALRPISLRPADGE